MLYFIVLAVRLIVPFTIIRWPFWGTILAIVADTFDFTLLYNLGGDSFNTGAYQRLDKFLDTYFFFFMLYASAKLPEARPRKVLTALFSWRLAGVIAFEITGIRRILFFTPNVFTLFYLFIFGFKKFRPSFSIESRKNLSLLFFLILIPKLTQEYILHFIEYPLGIGRVWELIRLWIGIP